MIVEALLTLMSPAGRLSRLLHSRQQKSHQNGNDHNHNKEFYERKGTSTQGRLSGELGCS